MAGMGGKLPLGGTEVSNLQVGEPRPIDRTPKPATKLSEDTQAQRKLRIFRAARFARQSLGLDGPEPPSRWKRLEHLGSPEPLFLQQQGWGPRSRGVEAKETRVPNPIVVPEVSADRLSNASRFNSGQAAALHPEVVRPTSLHVRTTPQALTLGGASEPKIWRREVQTSGRYAVRGRRLGRVGVRRAPSRRLEGTRHLRWGSESRRDFTPQTSGIQRETRAWSCPSLRVSRPSRCRLPGRGDRLDRRSGNGLAECLRPSTVLP